jgi:type III pantothenate kinase
VLVMILAIDIGNTQTVMGLFGEDRLGGHWRISTDATLTADEIRLKIGGLLASEDVAWTDISRVVIASVVPKLTESYDDVSRRATGRSPMIVGPGLKTGMRILYDQPGEVGADRIANAVAAFDRFGGPVVVVDFGTATTIDVVDAEGAYLGGAIAPGVETSAEALFSKAARLSKVDLEDPGTAIGRNTRASVQAGVLLGQAAMVDGLVRRVWSELGVETRVVGTGGLAERMSALCATITDVDPDLTLEGLMTIYRRNA